jgi:hypothetical protein
MPNAFFGLAMRSMSFSLGVTLSVLLALEAGFLMPTGVLGSTPAKAVEGKILRIDGDVYVIRDSSGKEVRLHVDDKTDRLDHAVLQIGDPVRAYVSTDGHATSIKHLGPVDRIEEDDTRKPGRAPTK